ncbi:MAG: hypothetical protein WCJ61_00790 [Paludibacter sp.]
MKRTILILLCVNFSTMLFSENLDSMFVELDKNIAKSDYYIGLKEEKIQNIKSKLKFCPIENDKSLDLNAKLFEEYKSFKFDSAYVYATKTLVISRKLNDSEQIARAKIRLMFCYLSSGMFKESFDLINGINVNQLKPALKLEFYGLMARLYYDMADYNSVEPFRRHYINAGIAYSDSAIALIPAHRIERLRAMGLLKMKKKDYNGAIEDFQVDAAGVYQIRPPQDSAHQVGHSVGAVDPAIDCGAALLD